MSQEAPIILYVGDVEAGQMFLPALQAYGGYAYMSEVVLETLGMYITYFPDLVILNAALNSELIQETYFHLCSVNAAPMIILADHWQLVQSDGRRIPILPPTISHADLLVVIRDLIQGQQPIWSD
jgi:hypothetical protein